MDFAIESGVVRRMRCEFHMVQPQLQRSPISWLAYCSPISINATLYDADCHYVHSLFYFLGTACGRYFRTSTMAITDPGDSEIDSVFRQES